MEAFRATAQDNGIAGFEAKRACIGGYIGAAFIDHADHAQWCAHTLDMEARRPVPLRDDLAHGIGLLGHGAQGIDDALDAAFIQHETVEHGC